MTKIAASSKCYCNLTDPADRMIVASAIHSKTAIVTGDKKIINYAKQQNLDLIAV